MSFQIYSYVFILVGIFTIWGTLAKPAFFWESRKAERTRRLIGDGPTMILYLVIGGACVLAGALTAIGIFNLG